MVKKITGMPDEFQEIYDRLVMPVDTNITLEKVILSEENQYKVKQFLAETKNRNKFIEYGLTPMNRILMYGASGCGKTFLTKALANDLGYAMLYVDIAQALCDNTVSRNISDIFKLAGFIEECVIFLDECDSIAWNRDDTSSSDSGIIRRATNSIFQQLDQMSAKCIFVSCTNLLNRIDPAFERRHQLKMEFRKPQLNIYECIEKFILPKFVINNDVDNTVREIIERRASQNAKLSYYEIEGLINRAMKRSLINGTNVVKTSEIYDDLAKAMNVKLKLGTAVDNETIFHNELAY